MYTVGLVAVRASVVQRTLWLLVAAVLNACGGGSGSTPPTSDTGGSAQGASAPSILPPGNATPVTNQATGRATLAPNVVVLSDTQNAQITASTPSTVTFAGAINLSPGSVVLTNDTVFKVGSVATTSGNTTVGTLEPTVEEIFDTLQISGSFSAKPELVAEENTVTPPRLAGVRVLEPARGQTSTAWQLAQTTLTDYSYLWPLKLELGDSNYTQTVTGNLTATLDYDFRKADGGLQSALLSIDSYTKADISALLRIRETTSAEKTVARVRIPIPVSVADRLLNAVGIRIVSLVIPFSIGARYRSQFDISLQSVFEANGLLELRYNKDAGGSINDSFVAGYQEGPATPVTPGGAPILARFTNTSAAYVQMRPALAFLDRVALLGVSTSISAEREAALSVVPESPFFCAGLTPSVMLRANGFFKGVGLKESKTTSYDKTLVKFGTAYLGACKAPTVVDLVSTNSGQVGQPMTLQATVNLDATKVTSTPTSGPTGAITMTIGDQQCTAQLTNLTTSSASGSCAITPRVAGPTMPVSLSYAGDPLYAPSANSGAVTIAKSSTFTASSSAPNPSQSGTFVTLSASVAPSPTSDGTPTGEVTFIDLEGPTLCVVTLNAASSGTCSAEFTRTRSFRVSYSGDENYLPSSSSDNVHTVTPPQTIGTIRLLEFSLYDGALYHPDCADMPCESGATWPPVIIRIPYCSYDGRIPEPTDPAWQRYEASLSLPSAQYRFGFQDITGNRVIDPSQCPNPP